MALTLIQWGVLTLVHEDSRAESEQDKLPGEIPLYHTEQSLGRNERPGYAGQKGRTKINLPIISGHHCRIILRDGTTANTFEVLVEDTSSNGTFVNGSAIDKKHPAKLQDGDELMLFRRKVVKNQCINSITYKFAVLPEGHTEEAKALRAEGAPPPSVQRPPPAAADAGPTQGPGMRSPAEDAPPDATHVAGQLGSGAASPRGVGLSVVVGGRASEDGANSASVLAVQLHQQLADHADSERALRRQTARMEKDNRELREKLESSMKRAESLAAAKAELEERLSGLDTKAQGVEARLKQEWGERLQQQAEAAVELRKQLETERGLRQGREMEVERLGRQAEAARRSTLEKDRVITALQDDKAALEQRVADAGAKLATTAREVAEKQQQLRSEKQNSGSLMAQLNEARATEEALREHSQGLEGQLRALKQGRAELEGRLAAQEEEIRAATAVETKLEEARAALADVRAELTKRKAEGSRLAEEAEDLRKTLQGEQAASTDLRDQVAEVRSQLSAAEQRREAAEVALSQRDEDLRLAREAAGKLEAALQEERGLKRSAQFQLESEMRARVRVESECSGLRERGGLLELQLQGVHQAFKAMREAQSVHMARLEQHLAPAGDSWALSQGQSQAAVMGGPANVAAPANQEWGLSPIGMRRGMDSPQHRGTGDGASPASTARKRRLDSPGAASDGPNLTQITGEDGDKTQTARALAGGVALTGILEVVDEDDADTQVSQDRELGDEEEQADADATMNPLLFMDSSPTAKEHSRPEHPRPEAPCNGLAKGGSAPESAAENSDAEGCIDADTSVVLETAGAGMMRSYTLGTTTGSTQSPDAQRALLTFASNILDDDDQEPQAQIQKRGAGSELASPPSKRGRTGHAPAGDRPQAPSHPKPPRGNWRGAGQASSDLESEGSASSDEMW